MDPRCGLSLQGDDEINALPLLESEPKFNFNVLSLQQLCGRYTLEIADDK